MTLFLPRCSCDAACVPADRWEQRTSATANTEGVPSRRALQQSVEYKKHPSEAARQAEEQAARARAALAAQAAAAEEDEGFVDVLPPVATPMPVTAAELPHSPAMQQMIEMGFTDHDAVHAALRANDFDLCRAVAQLLR